MVMDSLTRRIRRSGPNPTLKSSRDWGWWDSRSVTGTRVNDENSLGLTAFYRGVKLIAESIAAMPLHVYQEQTDGTRTGITTPETSYLWGRPNKEMTRVNFWTHVLADEVRGNGFMWVEKNTVRPSDPLGIWHLDRRRVRVGRTSSGQKIYELDGETPMIDFRDGGEIVHIPNWGNGLVGYDLVRIAKDALALGLSAQEYANRFFDEGGVPAGYISTDQTLTPAESDKLSEAWTKKYGGMSSNKAAVLSNGAKFFTTQLDPEKSQLEALRSFQVEEVARLLGLPPWMLGEVAKSTSWGSGIAEQGRFYMAFTASPHVIRIEQAIDDDLLVRPLTRRYVKLDPDGLLRGTPLQRAQFYTLGYGRWLTPNDIRRMEEMPAVEGGDEMPTGANLIPLDQLGENFTNDAKQAAEQPRATRRIVERDINGRISAIIEEAAVIEEAAI